MTRVAAVDCGTNSIRLLIADIDQETRALTDVVRTMEIVRLGYGVDRTGLIDPAAMARTLAACERYAARCRAVGAEAVRFVATSASRDAHNAAEFVAGVRRAFGDFDVAPEVVSGQEEATLSFQGATGDVQATGIPGPYLVIDIGGGSTEFVRGTTDVAAALSLDVGCVRLTERHLHTDPPTMAEVGAAVDEVEAAIDAAEEAVPLAGLGAVVGLAGSVTTVTAHALELTTYDPGRIHLARLSVAEHQRACTDLVSRTRSERAALGFMHPGRVDVIGAGALVWRQILRRAVERSPGVGVVTSEHDILDGIALSLG